KAPALIRDATARLLRPVSEIAARKLASELNSPQSSRFATMSSTIDSPTLRTAASPKRLSRFPFGVKLASDSLTSGALTLSPIRRHSARHGPILVRSSATDVRAAAMYSAG